ncbi:PHP domain-containing protein, partial [Elusimicrobiota bacterium]
MDEQATLRISKNKYLSTKSLEDSIINYSDDPEYLDEYLKNVLENRNVMDYMRKHATININTPVQAPVGSGIRERISRILSGLRRVKSDQPQDGDASDIGITGVYKTPEQIYTEVLKLFGINKKKVNSGFKKYIKENASVRSSVERYRKLTGQYDLEPDMTSADRVDTYSEDPENAKKLNHLILNGLINGAARPELIKKRIKLEFSRSLEKRNLKTPAEDILDNILKDGDLERLSVGQREAFFETILLKAKIFKYKGKDMNFYEYMTALEACQKGYFGKIRIRNIPDFHINPKMRGALYSNGKVIHADSFSVGSVLTDFVHEIGHHYFTNEAYLFNGEFKKLHGINKPGLPNAVSEGISCDVTGDFLNYLAKAYPDKEQEGKDHGFDYYAEREYLKNITSSGEYRSAQTMIGALKKYVQNEAGLKVWQDNIIPRLYSLLRGPSEDSEVHKYIFNQLMKPVLKGKVKGMHGFKRQKLIDLYKEKLASQEFRNMEKVMQEFDYHLVKRAIAKRKKGKFARAANAYRMLIRRRPDAGFYWHNLRTVYQDMEEFKLAAFIEAVPYYEAPPDVRHLDKVFSILDKKFTNSDNLIALRNDEEVYTLYDLYDEALAERNRKNRIYSGILNRKREKDSGDASLEENINFLEEILNDKNASSDERLRALTHVKEFVRPADKSPIKNHIHTRSFYSDGRQSPAMIVYDSWKKGVKEVAITDRYNLIYLSKGEKKVLRELNEGIEEAVEAGNILGVNVIPGVEITTKGIDGNEKNQRDILVYFRGYHDGFDLDNKLNE